MTHRPKSSRLHSSHHRSIFGACLRAHITVTPGKRDAETLSLFVFIETTSEFLFTKIPHFSVKKTG